MIRAYVDRIEANLAVIVPSDGSGSQFDLPVEYLPPGTVPGDHLVISLRLDPAATERTRQNLNQLRQELIDTTQETQFKL